MIDFVPFQRRHVNQDELCGLDCVDFMNSDLSNDFTLTCFCGDKTVAYVGIMKIFNMGYVWMIPTIHFKTFYRSMLKIIKLFIRVSYKKFDVDTLVTGGEENATIRRYITWLGFKKNGALYERGQ